MSLNDYPIFQIQSTDSFDLDIEIENTTIEVFKYQIQLLFGKDTDNIIKRLNHEPTLYPATELEESHKYFIECLRGTIVFDEPREYLIRLIAELIRDHEANISSTDNILIFHDDIYKSMFQLYTWHPQEWVLLVVRSNSYIPICECGISNICPGKKTAENKYACEVILKHQSSSDPIDTYISIGDFTMTISCEDRKLISDYYPNGKYGKSQMLSDLVKLYWTISATIC